MLHMLYTVSLLYRSIKIYEVRTDASRAKQNYPVADGRLHCQRLRVCFHKVHDVLDVALS